MVKIYSPLFIAAVFFFFMTPAVFAQETTDVTPTTPATTTVQGKGVGRQIRQAVKEQRLMTTYA